MTKLLDLMDHLFKQIQDGHAPDFRLLHDIGGYLSGYPDQVHHPKEDLIYRRLRKSDPQSKKGQCAILPQQHYCSPLTAHPRTTRRSAI
ncbi:MAG: hypothetical protein KJO31_06560 [Gammaproteobacteria bacterium]|nr:hypothetical protein [Gammaproteobacteria bacterium]